MEALSPEMTWDDLEDLWVYGKVRNLGRVAWHLYRTFSYGTTNWMTR